MSERRKPGWRVRRGGMGISIRRVIKPATNERERKRQRRPPEKETGVNNNEQQHRSTNRVILNPAHDEKLYAAPINPPNTGTRFTSGIDLYLHIAQSGKEYYYTHAWSMWQGSTDEYELISKEAAIGFFESCMSSGSHWVQPSQGEIDRVNELGFEMDVETA